MSDRQLLLLPAQLLSSTPTSWSKLAFDELANRLHPECLTYGKTYVSGPHRRVTHAHAPLMPSRTHAPSIWPCAKRACRAWPCVVHGHVSRMRLRCACQFVAHAHATAMAPTTWHVCALQAYRIHADLFPKLPASAGASAEAAGALASGGTVTSGGKIVWTRDEDAKLVVLVTNLGNKWETIASYFPPYRTAQACRSRYERLQQKGSSSPLNGQLASPIEKKKVPRSRKRLLMPEHEENSSGLDHEENSSGLDQDDEPDSPLYSAAVGPQHAGPLNALLEQLERLPGVPESTSHESLAALNDLADINSNQPSSMDTAGARSPQPRALSFAGSCMVHRHRSLPITFSVVVR